MAYTKESFDAAVDTVLPSIRFMRNAGIEPSRPTQCRMVIEHFVLSKDYLNYDDLEKKRAYDVVIEAARDLEYEGVFMWTENGE